MSREFVNIEIEQADWDKLHEYCQLSGKAESDVLGELISLLNPPSFSKNSDEIQQFKQFSQDIPIPMILIRVPEGKINYANAKAISILGFSKEALLNLSLSDLYYEKSEHNSLIDEIITQNTSKNYEIKLRKQNNSFLYASVFIQPLKWTNELVLLSWCDITVRYEVEQALRKKETFLQLVLDNIPQLIFWKDTNLVFLGCNRLWAKASGMSDPEQVKGKSDYDLYNDPNNHHVAPPTNNIEYYRKQDRRVIETGESELHFVEHKYNAEGKEVWYDTNKIPIKDPDGDIVGVMGTIENITERKLIERALFEEKELAKVTLQSIGEAVVTTNIQGMIREFNPVAQQLTGYSDQEAIGQHISQIFKLVDQEGNLLKNPIDQILQRHQSQSIRTSDTLVAKEGEQYEIDIVVSPIRGQDNQLLGVVLIFRDITQSLQLAHQLSWEASHDALTKLANRRELEKQLSFALESYKTEGIDAVLCYLDLDQFKIVNDTCGHIAGDELLRQITRLLQQRVRNTDILARLGGDEFALLLRGCSLEQAESIADILRELIQDFRFSWEEHIFSIGVSIGIVALSRELQTVTAILNAADAACYTAKEQGRNCLYIYQTNDIEVAKQLGQSKWIVKLKQALNDDYFRLYRQKIMSIQSPVRVHYEILLRLSGESGKLISPSVFIPAAERYNLMADIDQWVIKNFLKAYSDHYQEQFKENPQLLTNLYTINLSAVSLKNKHFLKFIKEQLSHYQVNPRNLCFEITETTAITNFSQAIALIESIKELGCCFALDDFGSGMSSLSYLKHLPVDYLKIDGSFVRNLDKNSVNYSLVDCFHRIGDVMDMETIAECVEDQATLEILQGIGVDYAQGFGIERPIPLSF